MGSSTIRTLALLATLFADSAFAGEKSYVVYFSDDTGFPRHVRGTSPLSDLIEAFFEGPTPSEQAQGAHPFQYGCVWADQPRLPERAPCGYKDIVRYVWIQNEKAYIEVAAYPNASASGIWDTIDKPLSRIIKQFPHLKTWGFSMQGHEVLGGDFGSPCGNKVCFLFSDVGPDQQGVEDLANYGIKRLEKR